MRTKIGQVLIALGITGGAATAMRWHGEIVNPQVDIDTTLLAGIALSILAVACVALGIMLIRSCQKHEKQQDEKSHDIKPTATVRILYPVLCSTLGAMAVVAFFLQNSKNILLWLFSGPPLIIANILSSAIGINPAWAGANVYVIMTVFPLIYYHLLLYPAYRIALKPKKESTVSAPKFKRLIILQATLLFTHAFFMFLLFAINKAA